MLHLQNKKTTRALFYSACCFIFFHLNLALGQNNAIFSGGNSDGFAFKSLGGPGIEIPLPIRLASFTGTCNSRNILLEWTTASEENNDYFSVESSYDGFNWQTSGVVDAIGHSIVEHHYSFIDDLPLAGERMKKILYYRLKQFDFDGKSTYSNIIAIKDCAFPFQNFLVYPNPSSGKFSIYFFGENYPCLLDVYNEKGNHIYSLRSFTKEIIDVDLRRQHNSLPAGTYLIQLQSPGVETVRRKIIIKH